MEAFQTSSDSGKAVAIATRRNGRAAARFARAGELD